MKKSGHTLPGSCLENGRNTLNLLKQSTCCHCSNFMCLHPNQEHVLLRNILMCMLDNLDNLTYPVRNSMWVHHMSRLSNYHKRREHLDNPWSYEGTP
ncbi:hypothetical protein E2C01_067982 [Portunus trituberculatus]|uniref:Uncharacterized protein n=1 Tax=Portunus trituberculatus TaxID=210409 RepID=A0A5B7HVC3_PORTR|nr:hypothetical protein [Portunus trituberculatus]